MKVLARFTFAVLLFASLACNLQRVIDPSLPTSTRPSSPTSTEAPTLVPTPAPTLSTEARIESADQLFFYGDWDGALRGYTSALNSAQDDDIRAAALLGMGRTYIKLDRLAEAEESLNTLLGIYPASGQSAEAEFALAKLHESQADYIEAATAFQNYLDKRPGIIDAYVHEWRGDALYAAGDNEGAIASYQQAIAASSLDETLGLQIKVGSVYLTLQDYQTAILTFQNVYNTTTNDFVKAEMDLQMGRAYLALENQAQAHALFQDAVNNYPLAYSAYAALIELVDAGVPVDEFQRGLVDYYAATNTFDSGDAREVYSVAIAAFDRYLLTAPEDHADSVHWFRALSFRALGDYPSALDEFDQIIEDHAFDSHWVDAYREKALTQWLYLDDYDGAMQTLLDFVAATPSQPASAEFLFTAGRVAENGGRLTGASEIWPRVANEYPESEYAYDALFRAGMARYRLEDYAGAQSLFVRATQAGLGLEEQAQSQFWIAKTQQTLGDEAKAQTTWQQVVNVDPTGYYSERASDILDGLDFFHPNASYNFDYDVAAERAEAEAWIRSTFTLPENTDLSHSGQLAGDPRFIRGTELWHLGEFELSRAEFESLRADLTTDPANSYRLANYLIDLGLYRTGIFAAREVLSMAGMSDAATFNAPVYFNRLRFGGYYRELVEAEAAKEGIDPLFIYAMMRQESLFEGFVTSSAGARGLLQIIPSTGEEVATLSGWPEDFEADDLFRPMVSIRLGIGYLAIQLHAFDGNLAAALAAYNGGPNAAQYWLSLANEDPDLFVEVIQFTETRSHVRSVYELFDIYRNLYSVD